MDERRYVAYVDAITYAQIVEEKLIELTEDPFVRTARQARDTPDAAMIRAKLVLVAPHDVAAAFDELVHAWDGLCWMLSNDGPTHFDAGYPEYVVEAGNSGAVQIFKVLEGLKTAVRAKTLGELPSSRNP